MNKLIRGRSYIEFMLRTKLFLESKPRRDKEEQKLLDDANKMLDAVFRFVPQEDFMNLEQAQ